jgi:hypothetical protein
MKKKFLYYVYILEKNISLAVYDQFLMIINFFFDTMANSQNYNFEETEKEKILAFLTSLIFYGSACGAVLSIFLTRFNPKHLHNINKVCFIISFLPFFMPKPSLFLLYISRFAQGVFFEVGHVLSTSGKPRAPL